MVIKITKKQNVKVDGVKFVAVPQRDCRGCAFKAGGYEQVCTAVKCGATERADNTSVIFIRTEKMA